MGGLLSAMGLSGLSLSSRSDGCSELEQQHQQHAEEHLLRNINSLASEMATVRDTVNQLSSRLGGMAVMPGKDVGGLALAFQAPLPPPSHQQPPLLPAAVSAAWESSGVSLHVPVAKDPKQKQLAAARAPEEEDDRRQVLDVGC